MKKSTIWLFIAITNAVSVIIDSLSGKVDSWTYVVILLVALSLYLFWTDRQFEIREAEAKRQFVTIVVNAKQLTYEQQVAEMQKLARQSDVWNYR